MKDRRIEIKEAAAVGVRMRHQLEDALVIARAHGLIRHLRPRDWTKDPKTGLLVPDPRAGLELLDEQETWNLITNAGRAFIHKQAYDTTGLSSNGLNYVALSNDTVGETSASTTLSNEIAANGLTRAQGTVTPATGAGTQTTVAKTFTATGSQSAQKAALFSASSGGTMNHVLAFTQRNLINTDQLAITFTLTIS